MYYCARDFHAGHLSWVQKTPSLALWARCIVDHCIYMVCMCLYMYRNTATYIYIHIHIYIYTDTSIYIHTYIDIHACMCVCVRVCYRLSIGGEIHMTDKVPIACVTQKLSNRDEVPNTEEPCAPGVTWGKGRMPRPSRTTIGGQPTEPQRVEGSMSR